MILVAVSADYGAGGSRIGAALAERLGVPFVDRAIPMKVAERLDVPLGDALAHDEQPSPSLLERLISGFRGGDSLMAPLPIEAVTEDDFHRACEQVLRQQAATGRGVILGRGAVAVLRAEPHVLRVRLTGPREARERWARDLGEIDEETARRARRRMDQAQADYVRRFYGLRLEDPELYHLVLDSTALGEAASVELIAQAVKALAPTTAAAPPR
jgi:cytidylate kinase